jgi:hypothetical protein
MHEVNDYSQIYRTLLILFCFILYSHLTANNTEHIVETADLYPTQILSILQIAVLSVIPV